MPRLKESPTIHLNKNEIVNNHTADYKKRLWQLLGTKSWASQLWLGHSTHNAEQPTAEIHHAGFQGNQCSANVILVKIWLVVLLEFAQTDLGIGTQVEELYSTAAQVESMPSTGSLRPPDTDLTMSTKSMISITKLGVRAQSLIVSI